MELRAYQKELIDQLRSDHKNAFVVLPTGAGKTVCFSRLIKLEEKRTLVVAHRREILTQISIALCREGITHNILTPDSTRKRINRRHYKLFKRSFLTTNNSILLASAQTLAKRGLNERYDLAIFDEGHHYVKSGHWSKAVESAQGARLLFFTATPKRADGLALNDYASKLIVGATVQQLIEQNYLAKLRYFAPPTKYDTKNLKLGTTGDYSSRQMRSEFERSELVGNLVDHYKKHANNTRAICFASDIQSANEIADEFIASGVKSVALSSKTPDDQRQDAIDQFEQGLVDLLVNVDLFDEGFDVPAVETVILARPTGSLSKYLQMCGRAMRISDGKTHAIIIDPLRNYERHGMPTDYRIWSLNGDGKKGNTSGDTSLRVCDACSQPYENHLRECPYCGEIHVFKSRSTIDQVDGDLVELDPSVKTGLLAQVRFGNLSNDEYIKSQNARYIPHQYRRADLQRYIQRRYVRRLLSSLMSYWFAGLKSYAAGRVHFFNVFGVDVASVLILNKKDTIEFLDLFIKRFNYSLLTRPNVEKSKSRKVSEEEFLEGK